MPESLPPLPKTGFLKLWILLVFSLGFYVLILLNIVAVVAAAVYLIILTPQIVLAVRSLAGLELIAGLYVAVGAFVVTSVRGLFSWPDLTVSGIIPSRTAHQQFYTFIREVAKKADNRVFDSVILVGGMEVGVREELPRFALPGFGKRKLVIGMHALSILTTDQLRAILAHEFAHFAGKHTTVSNIVMRMGMGFHYILEGMRDVKGYLLNPFYYIFMIYSALHSVVYAAYERHTELEADRFAAQAYGSRVVGQALCAYSLESSFYESIIFPQVINSVLRRGSYSNLMHFTAVQRREFATK